MTDAEPSIVERLYEALVAEVRRTRPELLQESFTVAEIYQNLIPYRTHRERVGAEMNGDYEHALLRLLAGEGGYVTLESDAAQSRFEEELNSIHPDTGVYRNFAACEVRLHPERLEDLGVSPGSGETTEGPSASGDDGEGEAVGSPDGNESEADHHEAPDPDRPEDGVELDLGPPEVSGPEIAAETANGSERPEEGADVAMAGDGDGSRGSREDVEAGEALEEPASLPEGIDDGGQPGGTCLWCRESLPDRDDLRFCPFCGSSVDLRPCPECGAEVESDWIFCVACGAEAAD